MGKSNVHGPCSAAMSVHWRVLMRRFKLPSSTPVPECEGPPKCFLRFEGSLEVKIPTIWTNGKAQVGRVREEQKKRRCRCAKIFSRNTVFFQQLTTPAGRKVGSLKQWGGVRWMAPPGPGRPRRRRVNQNEEPVHRNTVLP